MRGKRYNTAMLPLYEEHIFRKERRAKRLRRAATRVRRKIAALTGRFGTWHAVYVSGEWIDDEALVFRPSHEITIKNPHIRYLKRENIGWFKNYASRVVRRSSLDKIPRGSVYKKYFDLQWTLV